MADFSIDGIECKRPTTYLTKVHTITQDSERLPGSYRLVAPYKATVYETIWTYKILTGAEYDILYNAFVFSNIANKSIEHTLKTINSNTGASLTYKTYTPETFEGNLIRLVNGNREYRDVTFTFIGVGGGE